MSRINLELQDPVVAGKLISFIAPCESEMATCITINGTDYTISDSKNNDIGGTSGLWVSGAVVSIILNAQTKRAYIQGTTISTTYDVPVPLSWVKDETKGIYYQEIAVPGILSKDTPIVDIVLGDDTDAHSLYLTAWSHITRVETLNNAIKLYADFSIVVAFNIQLKVVR